MPASTLTTPDEGPFADDETGDGYRRMFAALPVPAVLLDTRGFIRQANAQASAFLGLSHHAWLQRRSMLQLMAVDDRQRLMWRLNERSGHEVHEMQGISLSIEEHTVPCDLHLVHLRPPATREPMVLAVLVDRTLEAELRASEERVRLQSRRMADAMWASQSGFWEWDIPSDQIIHDDRFAQILGLRGLNGSPVRARELTELIHPEDRQLVRDLAAPTQSRAEAGFNIRMRMQHQAGGWVWLATRGRVLEWDEEDRPSRVGGAIHDVSQEVEREAELRAAKDRAEASERLKSQWLANVGHEVRTPLNSVIGLVQLMQEGSSDPHQREYLARVAESAEQLRLTLDDLLDNAKLEAGRLTIEQLPVDIHELGRAVVAMFRPDAESAGLALNCVIQPHVPQWLVGDPMRLRQIISNLLSNALKFTRRGSVNLVIEASEVADGASVMLQFTVVDTGIGIDPAAHERLFTPFFQADASTTRRFGGSGLGLSICKRLVELMGGRIGVVSSPGHGSRFWFTVRMAVMEVAPTLPAPQSQSSTVSGSRVNEAELPATAAAVDPTGPQALSPALHELAHLLMLHDPRAIALGESLLAEAHPETGAILRRALRLARNFDFDAALATLDSVSARGDGPIVGDG